MENSSVEEISKQMYALQEEYAMKLAQLRAKLPREETHNYVLQSPQGNDVTLSQLFDGKEHLVLIHNMGFGYPYCTMWGDGFRSIHSYIQQRCAFVVASPEDPKTLSKGMKERDWEFPMVSYGIATLAKDMGFSSEQDGAISYTPGFSVFRKEGQKIFRTSWDIFGPGDNYCNVFHFFKHLPKLADGEWFTPNLDAALPNK